MIILKVVRNGLKSKRTIFIYVCFKRKECLVRVPKIAIKCTSVDVNIIKAYSSKICFIGNAISSDKFFTRVNNRHDFYNFDFKLR